MKNLFKFLITIMISMFVLNTNVSAATTVSNETDLKNAINNNQDVVIGSSFTITSTINIPSSYSGTIDGQGNTLTLGNNVFEMFNISGGSPKFTNLNLDGATHGRLIRIIGGTLSYTGGSLKNGRSWVEGVSQSSDYSDGGAVYIAKAKATFTGTTFDSNIGVRPNNPQPRPDMNGHGGAIYANGSEVTIENSTVSNNVSGLNSGGGFLFSDNCTIVANGNTFSNNHAHAVSSTYVNQGGVFYLNNSSTLNSNTNIYNIGATFNTGGAIYTYASTVTSTSDKFNANNLGDGYGISGGAICSLNSTLTVNSGEFKVTGNSKVIYAGGMIDIVGSGNVKILSSIFEGSGAWWNGPSTATYGGGIAFETGSTATALIEDSTFKNMAADENGGAISVSTKKGEASSVNLTIKGSTFQNTRTRFAWKDTVGGGIYVGPGNTVNIENTYMTGLFAVRGGAIYNDGTVSIGANSSLIDNTAYQIGGAIYNDGVLTVDSAKLTNNRNAEGRLYPGKNEMVGGNIYANKDVTITPNASFDENDVRVLDGQSSILLTGTLTNKINVSISERPIGNIGEVYYEGAQRYIGYTVAKGSNGYVATETDAQKIHYVSKDSSQAIAAFSDVTSVGQWDYVLDPVKNHVVLGQRAKMIYHANLGQFSDTTTEKEQIYTIYSSSSPWTNIPQLTPWDSNDNPTRNNFTFVNWYNHNADGSEDNSPITDNEIIANKDANKFDFTLKFTSSTTPITTIVSPHIMHAYAGWSAEMKIVVTKIWDDGQNVEGFRPNSIVLTLTPSVGNKKVVTVQGDVNNDQWTYTFDKLLKFDSNNNPITYTISEQPILNYRIPEISNIQFDASNTTGTVQITNRRTPEYISISGKKVWNDSNNQDGIRPQSIEVLLKNGADVVDRTSINGTGNEWNYTFNNVLKYKNGVEVAYTVDETDIRAEYTKNIQGLTITNSYTPQTKSITVEKIWEDSQNQDGIRPNQIVVKLLKNGVDTTQRVTISEDAQGKWIGTFSNLPVYESGVEIAYTVEEEPVDGYVPSVSNFIITNTHTPEKIKISGEKTWNDNGNQDGVRPNKISVSLMKGNNLIETIEVTDANGWKYEFSEVDKYENQGQVISYSVVEEPVDKYTTSYNGYNVVNTHIPEVKEIEITKVWNDAENQDGIRPNEITVDLLKNNAVLQTVTLKANEGWKKVISGLPVYENGVAINYSITENPVAKYVSTINGFTVTNEYTPEKINIIVKKVWDDVEDKDKIRPTEVTVELLKNGVRTGNVASIKKDNNWEYEFVDLDKHYKGNLVEYSVVENEVNGYTTSYTPVENGVIVITNKHLVKPVIPAISNNPKKPEVKITCEDEGKVWSEEKQSCVYNVKAYKVPDTGFNSNMSINLSVLFTSLITLFSIKKFIKK